MSKPIGVSLRPATLLTAALSAVFVVAWSSGFIGAKLLGPEVSTLTVLMWRFVVVALVLSPFLWWPRRSTATRWSPSELARQVVVGALSQAGYTLTVYWAIALGVSTGTTALVDGVQPLVVAVLAGPLLGVATSRRQVVGLVAGLAGVAAVTWADLVSPESDAPWWAYGVPLLAMASLVGATFVSRRGDGTTTPGRALAVHALASAVLLSAAAVITGNAVPPATASFWYAVAWLVVLAGLAAYGAYWVLIERMGVTATNALMFLVPGVTTVWGAAVYGEPLTAMTVLGLAIALGAAGIVALPARSGPR